MKELRGLLLSGLLLLPLVGLAQDGATVQTPALAPSLADAKTLAANGHLDQALAELNALARVEPEEAGVEALRGIVLYQKEQLRAAETSFARAVAQDAQDRESMEMRGITLYRMGKPEDAIPLLEKADAAQVAGAN